MKWNGLAKQYIKATSKHKPSYIPYSIEDFRNVLNGKGSNKVNNIEFYNMRKQLTRLYKWNKLSPPVKSEFEEWNFNDNDLFYKGLKQYKLNHQHLLVPQRYAIPISSNYSKELWGLKLGRMVNRHRHRELPNATIQRLNDIGFVWDVTDYELCHIVLPCLNMYWQIRENTNIPQDFIVPKDEGWPVLAHGRLLGKLINRIRGKKHMYTKAQIEKLDEAHMIWSDNVHHIRREVVPRLEKYFMKNKHLDIPTDYMDSDGYELGRIWKNTNKNSHVLRSAKREFIDLGMPWDEEYDTDKTRVMSVEAEVKLAKCIQLYPDRMKNIKNDFIIPAQDWEKDLHGFQLGKYFGKIRIAYKRCELTQTTIDIIVQHGFGYKCCNFTYRTYPAIAHYHKIHGHCLVPRSFDVPKDQGYPLHTIGYSLGSYVQRVRSREASVTTYQKQKLDALHFVWDAKHHQWASIILPALQLFKQEHHHINIPLLYTTPSTWPKPLQNLKLGHTLQNLKHKSTFQTYLHQDIHKLHQLGLKFS